MVEVTDDLSADSKALGIAGLLSLCRVLPVESVKMKPARMVALESTKIPGFAEATQGLMRIASSKAGSSYRIAGMMLLLSDAAFLDVLLVAERSLESSPVDDLPESTDLRDLVSEGTRKELEMMDFRARQLQQWANANDLSPDEVVGALTKSLIQSVREERARRG